MSSTGLEVFDKTLQITHIWLDEIMSELDRTGSAPTTHCARCFTLCETGCR
jgi:hypothetical protein